MINITFTGNIYHSDGTPALDVKYQGLFIKVNPNSSESIWDTPRLSETNQYNFNLGDNTWLSQQDGYSQPFDKVVLCFWVDNIEDRDSTSLREWAFIEWGLDKRDVYVQNIQLQGHQHPICSFAPSGTNPLYIYDTGTTDEYQWIFEGKEHYHAHFWDEFEIFQVNRLDGEVIIDWGDTNTVTYPLSASPFEHLYDSAGDYGLDISVSNINDLSCTTELTHRVYNVIYNGLEWTPPIYQNMASRYTPNITGDLSAILGVAYYIDGDLVHDNFAFNEYFDHTFLNAGNHLIKQCIKYNDGFDVRVQCKDFIVMLDTKAAYISADYKCGLVFTDSSNTGAPPIVRYRWDVTDGLFVLSHVEGLEYGDWYYSWPYAGTFDVRMAITDSNDREFSVTKRYEVDECIGQGNSDGGMGGGSSPWVYSETKFVNTNQPMPVINITDVLACDSDVENKIILILEVIDMDEMI